MKLRRKALCMNGLYLNNFRMMFLQNVRKFSIRRDELSHIYVRNGDVCSEIWIIQNDTSDTLKFHENGLKKIRRNIIVVNYRCMRSAYLYQIDFENLNVSVYPINAKSSSSLYNHLLFIASRRPFRFWTILIQFTIYIFFLFHPFIVHSETSYIE